MQLGQFDQAKTILIYTSQIADPTQKDVIKLSLGDLYENSYQKNLEQFLYTDNALTKISSLENSINSVKNGLSIYLKLSKSNDLLIQLNSYINWLLLFSNLDTNIKEIKSIQQSELQNVPVVINKINSLILLTNQEAGLEFRIKFTSALTQISNLNQNFLDAAHKRAYQTLDLANRIGDGRNISKAYGLLGRVLLKEQKLDESQLIFSKAINIANVVHAPDLAYQWEWELGKIATKSGKIEVAIQYYKSAINHLDIVRKNFLPLPSNLQLSFLNKIEPIYTEYLSLLFSVEKPDLKSIIRINEKLQISELENYLQCGINLNLTSILDLDTNLSPELAIYILKLPDKFQIIARLKDGSLINYSANKKIIDDTVYSIKANIQSDSFQNYGDYEIQKLFLTLYKEILAPIKNQIPSKGSIVFSVDSNLQNIPWSLLFDGEQYLIEKYSISLALGSKIYLNGLKKTNPFKPFVAGLTKSPNLDYPALPYIQSEIASVKTIFPNSKFILDRDFTSQNLFEKSQSYSIVHIASHGEFSSDPQKTFILDWNGALKLSDLQQLVRSRNSPIELLILSACSTATGDRRSALGLAGATVQSGALSALGTLWRVDDESQALLMHEFYVNLSNGKSKTEALRLAQLALLNDHWAPFFWGAPVIIGDYL